MASLFKRLGFLGTRFKDIGIRIKGAGKIALNIFKNVGKNNIIGKTAGKISDIFSLIKKKFFGPSPADILQRQREGAENIGLRAPGVRSELETRLGMQEQFRQFQESAPAPI